MLVLTGGGGSRDASILPGRLSWAIGLRTSGLLLRASQACCINGELQMLLKPGLGRLEITLSNQADWLALVRLLTARGQTVVSVLHEISMALHADDLLVLAGGRLVHHGPCVDPASHRALEQVFDHRIAIHALQGQWVALPVAA